MDAGAPARLPITTRYLALGRAVTGEAMAQVFAEWRRARSPAHGGLVWFLRDLWPGAGWGLVDSGGVPKQCFHALRRVLAPQAITIVDEGVNGLVVHAFNDRPQPLQGRIEVSLYRSGDIRSGYGAREIMIPAHGAIEIAATDLFEGFIDLSFAYRFGPPTAEMVHATFFAGDRMLSDSFWFPCGLPSARSGDAGIEASIAAAAEDGDAGNVDYLLTVGSRRFAQTVSIEAAGFSADDNGFHLAPGQSRQVRLRPMHGQARAPRGIVTALNTEASARFALP